MIFETKTQSGVEISIIGEFTKFDRNLTIDNMHIQGPGAGSSSVSDLREAIRSVGNALDVDTVTIQGGEKTTGAAPGRTPKPVTIKVK